MTNPELSPVIITAAGEGSRIRDYMTSELGLPEDYPKHLLATGGPNGETLLGRIIRQSSIEPLPKPIVNVSETTMHHIEEHPDVSGVVFDTEKFRFSLDPLYYQLRRTGARVIGCAGDFYSDFNWKTFLDHHQASGAAMSLLVNQTTDPVKAAVFGVNPETHIITGLDRPESSREYDYTNIGAYIIDPTDDVLKVLDSFLPPKPNDTSGNTNDTIFRQFINRKLAGAVLVEGAHFNINTPDEYLALRQHTKASPLSGIVGV